MHTIVKMRDRRNTSLSVSSTSSSTSNTALQEKQPLVSEPSSPTLPSPATTKENVSKPNGRARVAMAAKLLAAVSALILVYHFIFCGRMLSLRVDLAGYGEEMEIVGGDELPSEPVALILEDKRGFSRWTMSIPSNASFPLRGQQYRDICTQGEVLRDSIGQNSRLVRAKDWVRRGRYYAHDPTFMEVDQAERIGALPVKSKHSDASSICDSSLTFSLEAQDSSFGKSLMMLWLSYGLAKKEGRAFFIDDSRWAYGKYRSYFAPPPTPKCQRPPPHHILPCPHTAKHLIVSSSTLRWTFGSSFEHEFLRLRKHGVERSHRIYDLVRTGYEDLFKLIGEDALYAESRIAQLKEDAAKHGSSTIGLHIRRGDRHPHEFEFSKDYLPLERYADAARRLLRSTHQTSLPHSPTDIDFPSPNPNPLLLASDDPETIASPELTTSTSPLFTLQKSQSRIQLATKATLDLTSPALPIQEPGSAYVKHVDENSGWEGGFYSALFFGVGRPKQGVGSTGFERMKHSSLHGIELPRVEDEEVVDAQVMRMRELVGRAYLLDLKVLGESEGGVVCAVSSATCRVLGVMVGWEGVKGGRWVNVDDGRVWSWDGRRV